jgi:uncharacterized protein YqgC (DUF456 family)
MANNWQRLRVGVGILLIIAGVVGMVLPLIPGIPLLVIGLANVGCDCPVIRAITGRLRRWGLLPARRSVG